MSQDTMELLKVLVATALVFVAGTLAMLYVILLLAQYGADLPMVGSLPLAAPPEMLPVLAESRIFSTLAAAHVTASGLVLLLTSTTIDMALLITSKAVAVVITAMLGFVGGHMAFLQLTESVSPRVTPLVPALIALVAFLILSTALSVQALRQLGRLRFAVALGLLLLGPMVLVWL